MNYICYYDGKIGSYDEIAISFTDRSIYFGDCIYDACLVLRKEPFLLDSHVDRLFRGCEFLSIKPPLTKAELSSLLISLCRECDTEIAFLYFQVSRSAPLRRHFYTEEDSSHLLITISPFMPPNTERPLRLIFARDERYGYCNIKTTNLLPAVLTSTRARNSGADEAVFVRNGIITECAHSNVFILKEGTLYTHPKGKRILPGIARERLIFICNRLGIHTVEAPFKRCDLITADEVLITSTTKLCQRACEIDGHAIGMKDEKRATLIQKAIFRDFYDSHNAQ